MIRNKYELVNNNDNDNDSDVTKTLVPGPRQRPRLGKTSGFKRFQHQYQDIRPSGGARILEQVGPAAGPKVVW